MAFDGTRVVLFGGTREDGITHLWDGATWSQVTPAVSPPAEGGNLAVMAYDRSTGTVVLFTRSGETWLWNGATMTWSKPVIAGATPPRRQEAAMAYDAATQTIVLFGGFGGSSTTDLDDTWVWSGRTRSWSKQNPLTHPSARMGVAMASDPAGGVVLFGGHRFSNPPATFDDTWTWNGLAGTWTKEHPPVAPAARLRHAMANDDARGQVVLFGGDATELPQRLQDDTWTWNGKLKKWTLQPSIGPSPRESHSMAYHGARREVVLYGGSAITVNRSCPFCTAPTDDTWTWGVG